MVYFSFVLCSVTKHRVISEIYNQYMYSKGYIPGGPGGPGGPSMIPVGNASPFSVVVKPRSPLSPLSPCKYYKVALSEYVNQPAISPTIGIMTDFQIPFYNVGTRLQFWKKKIISAIN